ncbi:MAG: alpha/beta hydrolase [Candidatus Nomurabacteria bacterium]|nr:alpha/beta hydrolase [Candidatus Nomurabacteria bacterium]
MEEYLYKERLYYKTNNIKKGRVTLVFIHGVSGSSSAWVHYENKFKDTYNIVSFDLRGHGKSTKPTKYESYKIELFADDLEELLKHLNIEKFILISHSFGSLIALAFLNKYQEMVSGAILLSPHYKIDTMLSARIMKPFIYGIVSILPTPKSKTAGGHIDYSKYLNSGDWNIPRTYADVKNTSLTTYMYCSKQAYLFDGQKILEKIKIPTLIIHGENDSIFPVKYARELNESIKGSEIVVIKNTDHILVLNNFKEVSSAIENFVGKINTPR